MTAPFRRSRAASAAALALASALALTACSQSPVDDSGEPVYQPSDDVQARVLPQLAATGEDVEAVDLRRDLGGQRALGGVAQGGHLARAGGVVGPGQGL